MKQNLKFSSSVTLALGDMLRRHLGLVAVVLHSTNMDHFHHRGKFYQTELMQVVHSCGKNHRGVCESLKLEKHFWGSRLCGTSPSHLLGTCPFPPLLDLFMHTLSLLSCKGYGVLISL